jgi:hypothetical protein
LRVNVCDVCYGKGKLTFPKVVYKFKKPAGKEEWAGTVSIKFYLCEEHRDLFKKAGLTGSGQLDEAIRVAKAAGVRVK